MVENVKFHRNARPLYEPGEVIARLSSDGAIGLEEELGLSIVERFDFGPRTHHQGGDLVRVKLPDALSVEDAVDLLSDDPRFEFAEPNNRYYLDGLVNEEPNDLHRDLWALKNTGRNWGTPGVDIDIQEAWKFTKGDREHGPIVAIIDSGVDTDHPDLKENLWVNEGEIPGDGIDNDGNGVVDDVHGYNAFHDNSDLSDGKVHGTHVAGTVGAVGNNGIGITGVAQEARLMTVKIFGDTGHTNQATVLRGLAYADRMGARITTNSWGGIYSQAMELAYAQSPALHIASAGNSGRDNDEEPHFPGSYPIENMIAVAASDNKDKIGSFSSFGDHTVHLAAPGVNIYSTLPGGRYKSFSGTSMACPHVGGVAALILTQYPEATNEQVKERLMMGTEVLEEQRHLTISGGRLNAALALESDTVAPGPAAGFQATARAGEVTVSWKTPGDDGDEGVVRSTQVKISKEPITQKTFCEAETLYDSLPNEPGTPQSVRLQFPLQKNPRTMHLALQSRDNVGNSSPLQNTKVVIPAAELVFIDNGSHDHLWRTDDHWSRVTVPGQGTVWTDSAEGDYGYGTEARLDSPSLNLRPTEDNVLRFQARLALGRGDYFRVQATEDGRSWRTVATYEQSSDWSDFEVPLSRYDGKSIQLRFLLRSDQSGNDDGVFLSALEVLGRKSPSPG